MRSLFTASLLFTVILQSPLCLGEEPPQSTETPPAAVKVETTAAVAPVAPTDSKDTLESYSKIYSEQTDQPAEFFFNWGTLYLKEKKNPEAFVALQKSIFLQPWSRSSWQQLALAKENLSPDLLEYRPDHWYSWWPSLFQAFSWRWFLSATLLATALYFSLSIQKSLRHSPLRSGSLFMCVFLFLLFFFSYLQQSTPAAIVKTTGAALAGPASSYPEVRRLPVGAMLSLEENRDSWCKVRYRNPEAKSEVSWMECASLIRL